MKKSFLTILFILISFFTIIAADSVVVSPDGIITYPPNFLSKNSDGMRIVITDKSTNPTTPLLILNNSQNAVRIWTGERPVDELWLDVYYKTNNGSTVKVRLYRWQGRILYAPPNSTIKLGTTNKATLCIAPMTVSTNLIIPSGITNFALCDRGGPPLWTPSSPHVVLPSNGMSFTIVSNGTEQAFFVSEFDGLQWSPLRWYFLEANANRTITCTFKQIAIANYKGTSFQVIAPIGSIIGGQPTTMSLPYNKSGKEWRCASVSDFLQACSNAVCGEQVVLEDGIYAIPCRLNRSNFTANIEMGFQSMDGITIRSRSGNPRKCIIVGDVSTNGGFIHQWPDWPGQFDLPMKAPGAWVGIGWDFEGHDHGIVLDGGQWYWQDCWFHGKNTNMSGDDSGNTFYTTDKSGRGFYKALRCTSHDSGGADWWMTQLHDSIGFPNYRRGAMQLIDCVCIGGTSNNAGGAIYSDYSGCLELYGCEIISPQSWFGGGMTLATAYNMTPENIPQRGITAAFFTKARDGTNGVNAYKGGFTCSLFGCDILLNRTDGTITPDVAIWQNPLTFNYVTNVLTNTFIQFNRIIGTNGTIFSTSGGSNINVAFSHNILSNNTAAAQQYAMVFNCGGGNIEFNGNIVVGAPYGVIRHLPWYPVYHHPFPQSVIGNTLTGNNGYFIYADWGPRDEDYWYVNGKSNWIICATNNANVTCVWKPVNLNSKQTNSLFSGYNTWGSLDGVIYTNMSICHDTTTSYAQVDGRNIPTVSGNCDDNGIGLGWCGDSDPYGLVWLFHPNRAPRGARAVQRFTLNSVLYPDAY